MGLAVLHDVLARWKSRWFHQWNMVSIRRNTITNIAIPNVDQSYVTYVLYNWNVMRKTKHHTLYFDMCVVSVHDSGLCSITKYLVEMYGKPNTKTNIPNTPVWSISVRMFENYVNLLIKILEARGNAFEVLKVEIKRPIHNGSIVLLQTSLNNITWQEYVLNASQLSCYTCLLLYTSVS